MKPKLQPIERLEKRLARVAREQGLDQERLRRWVSFLALCGVLEKALADGIVGSYYLKGGVALELRFATRARATKDLDLGLDGVRGDRLNRLQRALEPGFDDFTFRLKAQTKTMEQADTIRLNIAIAYKTRAWQTIEVDLGPAKTNDIDFVEPRVQGLMELGLPVASPIRCLGLAEQAAQKLHACTGPFAAGRARDVLDILLIEMLGSLDYRRTADAVQTVFAERATHELPTVFRMPIEWRRELEALAGRLGFPHTSAVEKEERFTLFIQRLTNYGLN